MRNENLKLDLGCGRQKKEGFLGVDIQPFEEVDLVCDLRNGDWPWPEGSVAEVQSRHFVEHLTGAERITFFNELHRVMVPGSNALIVTPHWSHECAYGDPTHAWPPVTNWTYFYLNKLWREKHAPHVPYTCDFEFKLTATYHVADEVVARMDDVNRRAMMLRNVNTAFELVAVLTKPAT